MGCRGWGPAAKGWTWHAYSNSNRPQRALLYLHQSRVITFSGRRVAGSGGCMGVKDLGFGL